MPSPYVKELAKKSGKSESEIERLWNKAKGITSDTFGKPEKEWGDKEYKYTSGTVENMLGLNENLSAAKFVNSGLSAKEFLEQVVSSDFNIDNIAVDKEEDEEEKKGHGEIRRFDDPEMDTADKDIRQSSRGAYVSPRQEKKLAKLNKTRPNSEDFATPKEYMEALEKWEANMEKYIADNPVK